jgi:hypothetical protein
MVDSSENNKLINLNKPEPDPGAEPPQEEEDLTGTTSFKNGEKPPRPHIALKPPTDSDWADWEPEEPRKNKAGWVYRPPAWEWWAPLIVLIPLVFLRYAFAFTFHTAKWRALPFIIPIVLLGLGISWWRYKRDPSGWSFFGNRNDPDYWAHRAERRIVFGTVVFVLLPIIVIVAFIFFTFFTPGH